MVAFSLELLGLRIFISMIGIIGNVLVILSIMQSHILRVKTFEVFLLGLATFNLEEIVIVDIYDITLLQSTNLTPWSCKTLKFMTILGEVGAILFTVLISIFRCQKLKDAERRVNLPIVLDNISVAWGVSGICVVIAILMSTPTYFLHFADGRHNATYTPGCPLDFFQCHKEDCPFLNAVFKYIFLFLCNMLPLAIVTWTSCIIIKVLMDQKRVIIPVLGLGGAVPPGKKTKSPKVQRSTVAVLAAMGVFQIDWTLYLVLHLAFSPTDFAFWSEIEFFITTSYTTISPYVYGIGNNLFSLKHLCKR